jgi:hypothetical protein
VLAAHLTRPQSKRLGFILPREFLICLRIVANWTMKEAAARAEVHWTAWQNWELGLSSLPGSAWRILLVYAGLPQTWRPPDDLCRYASTLIGHRCDVVQVHRELNRPASKSGSEPIVQWRKKQAEALGLKAPLPPVQKVVLRRRAK